MRPICSIDKEEWPGNKKSAPNHWANVSITNNLRNARQSGPGFGKWGKQVAGEVARLHFHNH